MPDLSQYLPLLSTTDDATIAGMAGCSVDDVAAFRAANAPAPSAPAPAAADAAGDTITRGVNRRIRAKSAPEDPPAAPPPSLASYVAELPQVDAEALYEALRKRLHPAAPVEQSAPSSVRLRVTATLTGPDGKPRAFSFRDVISGDLAAHLWSHHRDAVERYPVVR